MKEIKLKLINSLYYCLRSHYLFIFTLDIDVAGSNVSLNSTTREPEHGYSTQ